MLLKEGKLTGAYESQKLIKFYSGEYYYSLGLLENSGNEEDSEKKYRFELIRPKNYFYGEAKDIFGNRFEEFAQFDR